MMYVRRRNRVLAGTWRPGKVLLRELCLPWDMFSDFKYPEKRQMSPERNLLCKKSKILTEWFEAQVKKPPKHHGTTRSRSQGLAGIFRLLVLFSLGGFALLLALKKWFEALPGKFLPLVVSYISNGVCDI